MKRILQIVFPLLLLCGACFAQGPYPGQPGNPVGYAAYGSLNATACSAFSSGSSWAARSTKSNCTYSTYQTINCNFCAFIGVDFYGTGTTAGTLVSGSNVMFIGCRFQSNDLGNYNLQVTGTNVFIIDSSIVPLASFLTSPPGSLWPTAGAGTNSNTIVSGTNAINGNDGYQYGINVPSGGPLYAYGLDIWGYGNAIVFYSTTAQMTVLNSWVHDPADPVPQVYHMDGAPSYLNGAAGVSNVTFQGNTACMLGNTQTIALQNATSGYTGMQLNFNYLCGNEKVVALCQPGSVQCTGTFAHNVLGTDVLPGYSESGQTTVAGSVLYSTTIGSNLVWTGDTINFRSGTTWTDGDGWAPTSGMNGQYWIPTSVSTPNSSTDQSGNTHSGLLSSSSLLWLSGAKASKTITLTAGNTGNLSGISIGFATGTQFSQTNNCPATLSNAASCTITITYAPTGTGPVTDVLQITDSDPSSPQIVPLLGIDAPSTAITSTCGSCMAELELLPSWFSLDSTSN